MNEKWRIGEVAKLLDLSTDALRYYEKEGLLRVSKDKENGYRHYEYDELIRLMDIQFFRKMDVAVNDVRKIIREKELDEISQILQESSRNIAAKIEGLVKQQAMLTQVIEQYRACEERLGVFALVAAPEFKFKLLGSTEESMFSVIERIKSIDESWLTATRYVIWTPERELADGNDFAATQLGISLVAENAAQSPLYESLGLARLPAAEYFHAIVATDYAPGRNEFLAAGLKWLESRGKKTVGGMLGRYLASCHKHNMDYYEIWLKVQDR